MWNQDLYTQAWHFAAEAHGRENQTYPGNNYPYIFHVGMVAMETMAALAEESYTHPDLAVQCALLHDVIEDTAVTYEQIKNEFGSAVANGVLALTKNPAVGDKPAQMADSLTRIQEQSHEIWIVKLADRISNLQAPPHYWGKEKTIRYRDEAQLIYNALSPASPFLAKRLASKIEGYQEYISSSKYRS